ncbi:MAG: IclR family transcriptional regulator [Microthrixaceae bacterium]
MATRSGNPNPNPNPNANGGGPQQVTASGVGVVDKAMAVVAVLEAGPARLAELTDRTGLSRATTHRLATSLETHGLVRRTAEGEFALGFRLLGLARAALNGTALAEAGRPLVAELRDTTGESAQLWLPDGDWRVCLIAVQAGHELRTIVDEGARMPIEVGSGGRALRGDVGGDGWAATVGERAEGVASVSAPVRGPDGVVLAAVGVSGPLDRLGADPGGRYGQAVTDAAARLAAVLSGNPASGE